VPEHAKTIRPAVVEMPLWAVSRLARLIGPLISFLADRAAACRAAYRAAEPAGRRVAVLTAAVAVVSVACVALAVLLLFTLR
jgi:hypothetical protein